MNAAQLNVVLEEALHRSENLPVHRRVLLYRGLAEICGDEQSAAGFCIIANELEAADAKCRQLELTFSGSAPSPSLVTSRNRRARARH